jgi:UPF0755 protein
MTVRRGGGPRDPRSQARPYAEDAYATEAVAVEPDPARYGRNQRAGGRGSHGAMGLVKFLIFALVLAAIVMVVSLTALRPIFNTTVLSWAAENPAALQLPFVKDLVREDLGAALTTPASSDSAQVEFVVEEGDTASTIGARLASEGLITDPRTFVFLAIDQKRTGDLQQGTFVLRKNMTPDQLVAALLAAPEIKYIDIGLRTGLRLEQITAKLQTLEGLEMDPQDFYDLVKSPPAKLVADYPWLKAILADQPKGTSLEGFLWPATYRVLPDTSAEELVRLMLDGFVANVGEDRLNVPKERGLTFYQVLTLASIVEREAVLDEERPTIAGVYQLRMDGYKGIAPILNSDPTVFYAIDTMALADLKFDEWQNYKFWVPPGKALADVAVTEALQGYQTYQSPGLIPGPIATPSLPSIDAALDPNVADGYIYFVAIPDGGGKHAFAKSYKAHQANLEKYGYK